MTEADELLKEVIEDHIYVGNSSNYCVFCGQWPDDHYHDCVILRIKAYLAKVEGQPATGE